MEEQNTQKTKTSQTKSKTNSIKSEENATSAKLDTIIELLRVLTNKIEILDKDKTITAEQLFPPDK